MPDDDNDQVAGPPDGSNVPFAGSAEHAVGGHTALYATPDEAAEFARRTGWAVFPARMARDEGRWLKQPRPGCMWKEESTSDPDEVRALWARYGMWDPEQRSMIAVHCGKSGLFVVDEDSPDLVPDGLRAALDKARTHIRRSVTRGTRHVYFLQPSDGGDPVGDSTYPGGDIKGSGWVAVSTDVALDVPPTQPPAEVLEWTSRRREVVTARRGVSRPATGADEASVVAWAVTNQPEPVVSDPSAFLARPVMRFWDRCRTDHRRQVCRGVMFSMFVEAMAGQYLLTDAVQALLEAYREARQRDGSWTRYREADFWRMWANLVDSFEAGEPVMVSGSLMDLVAEVDHKREAMGLSRLTWTDEQAEQARLEIEDLYRHWTAPFEGRDEDQVDHHGLLVAPSRAEDGVVVADMAGAAVDATEPASPAPEPSQELHVASERAEAAAVGAGVTVAPERDVEPVGPGSEEDPPLITVTAEEDWSVRVAAPATGAGGGGGPSGRGPGRIELGEAAFYGPHGDLVRKLEPHTEADPAALLITSLVFYGAWIGRSRWIVRGGSKHHAMVQAVVLGQTAQARKGTSFRLIANAWEPVMGPVAVDDPGAVVPTGPRPIAVLSGVGSGEKLIDLLAPAGTRVVILEEEFVALLKRMGREGSTLSTVIRSVFDGGKLQTHSRSSGSSVADGYSASLLGHATDDELLATLTMGDVYGGSANRLMWVRAHPPKRLLHDEEPVPPPVYAEYLKHLGVTAAGSLPAAEVTIAPEAVSEWERVYREVSEPAFGLYGAVVARAPANILRLALNYATSVGETRISVDSLRAAQAVWNYAQATAWSVFGVNTGSKDVDMLVRELAVAHADPSQKPWLTSAELRALYGSKYAVVRDQASGMGLVDVQTRPHVDAMGRPTAGRPERVTRLAPWLVQLKGLPDRSRERPDADVLYDL